MSPDSYLSEASFWMPDALPLSAWVEHAPFAFWLVDALRPRMLVELGTHLGYSYFAFCQAVTRLGSATQCFAIDTWEGDEHAGHYDETVFTCVASYNARHFARFSHLVRSTFDEALSHFEDGSIDLLHIDGRHFYEDVRHDFLSWLPKLSERGVVLFHDIAVQERGFGVYRLWEELRQEYPSFHFEHGHGLGVLGVGKDLPPRIQALFRATENAGAVASVQAAYARLGAAISDRYQLGQRAQEISGLRQAEAAATQEIERLRQAEASAAQEIERLRQAEAAAAQEIERLRQAQAETAQEAASLRSELGVARQTEERYRASKEHLRGELEQLRAELAVEQATVAQLRAELRRAEQAYAVVTGSTSWRLTSPLRRAAAAAPNLRRRTAVIGRSALALRQGPRAAADEVRRRRRLARDYRLIAASGLFDGDWYLAAYPDVASPGADPLLHFLEHGAAEGRRASPLFDTRWYLEQNPDVAATGMNPLAHFIAFGAKEGRDPNPMFDTDWYLRHNPDAAASGENPLRHFQRRSAIEPVQPGPRFDTAWYLEHNTDVARVGINPLAHFLLFGEQEDRAPNPAELLKATSRPVTAAAIECRKAPGAAAGQDIALFVTHSADGRLKPHVAHHLRALHRAGIRSILIVASDHGFEPGPEPVLAELEGLYVRANEGFDFAAWAHVLQLEPGLFAARTLILVNDSIVGPIDEARYAEMLERLRGSEADLIGATDNYERGWHIQSFFLAFKPRALSSFPLHRFLNSIVAFEDKESVINAYEIRLAPEMRTAGLRVEALFPSVDLVNATIFNWRELIRRGFPFIKVAVLRKPETEREWRAELAAHGFDLRLAEAALLRAEPPAGEAPQVLAGTRQAAPAIRSEGPARIAFIGPWNYQNGLGIASRGYLSALWHSGMEARIEPTRAPFHVHTRSAPMVTMRDFSGPPDVVVVHLNPDTWHLLTPEQRMLVESARLRIGLWVWEMAEVPETWREAFGWVDAVWAPSRYCAEAFAAAAPGTPIEVVPHVVAVEAESADTIRTRSVFADLGIPEGQRIVLYAFDGASYIARKNPAALVRAFGRSGLPERGWVLVLKTKNLFDQEEAGRQLLKQVEHTPGVVLVNKALAREEMDCLFRAADIYASPHCAEGFGLTIAEAMALGKQVVATDYSGSRDFLDHDCGFPVPARLYRLDRDHGHYKKGGLWAEVDEGALAEALAAAAAEIEAGDASRGERARRRVQEMLSAEAVGRAMREKVEKLLHEAPARRGLS